MNTKQQNIQKKIEIEKENSQHILSRSESMSLYSELSDINSPENKLLLRIKEMEEFNHTLQNIIKEGKAHLAEVETANAKFMSIMAHDLRNPFQVIIGILDILSLNLESYSYPEIDHLIQVAMKASNGTLALLENLFTWSVSQNIEKKFNPVKINLYEIITAELELVHTSAILKQISLTHSIKPDAYATADFEMVKTIFRNLIGNAIKYSNTRGSISIAAREIDQFVEIEIIDNGIGISMKNLKNLFRIDALHSTMGTNNEHGTGFGLLFCKEFVEIHGGEIWVESERGKGSIFKFTLPQYI